MMDRDLAELYGVETAQLKRAVKRNIERFPEDFMFQLTQDELEILRSQFVISRFPNEFSGLETQNGTGGQHGGRRRPPYAFTEQGVAMLSSVLRSPLATNVHSAAPHKNHIEILSSR